MATALALEFEKPIVELEQQIEELKRLASQRSLDVAREIAPLEAKLAELRGEIYRNLTPYQRVQVARHPRRPYTLDYISGLFTDFIELHGDRLFRDDPAIVGGLGRLDGRSVVVIGQQKGRDTKENLQRNFGMPHPEGYRKALRLMKLAERFRLPVVTLIDTPGAYPGLGAEERGQAEAIARNLEEMAALRAPIVAAVIGEGGSGGALALAVGDRVLMLENAIYSVISPEGCAAILWRDASPKERAAEALKLTAPDLLALGLVDEIMPEPPGGAHADPERRRTALGDGAAPAPRRARRHPDRTSWSGGAPRSTSGWGSSRKHRRGRAAGRGPLQGQPEGLLPSGTSPSRLRAREAVIVETDRGLDLGRVSAHRGGGVHASASAARMRALAPPAPSRGRRAPAGGGRRFRAPAARAAAGRSRRERREPERRVVRRATPADTRVAQELRGSEEDVRQKVRERVRDAPARDEGLGRRVAVGPQEAHGLLHGREARRLPQPGARSRLAVPDAHRAEADRRARRGRSASTASAAAGGSSARPPGCPSCARSGCRSPRTSASASTPPRSRDRAAG